MRIASFCRLGMVAAILLIVLPVLADTQFRARKMVRNDVPPGKGQCDIRLQVDDEVEVTVRGDLVYLRTIRGRDGRDDGSECNEPLPNHPAADFKLEVKDGRGETRLIAEPSRRTDFQAVVRIRDGDAGEGRYHFRLSWRIMGDQDYTDRGLFGDDGDRRGRFDDDDRRGGFGENGDRRGGPGGLTWNNAYHSGGPGRGFSTLTGSGEQRLSEANVDIDRGGKILVSFRTDRGRPLTLSGSMMGPEGGTLKADVAFNDRAALRGPMYLSRDANGTIYRITLDATNGQDRLHLEWERR
jgi:hypothetical protein